MNHSVFRMTLDIHDAASQSVYWENVSGVWAETQPYANDNGAWKEGV